MRAEGTLHVLRSLRSNENGGNGYALAGSSITLRDAQGEGNALAGVLVTGSGNLLVDNELEDSGGCEFDVRGAGTTDGGGSNSANGDDFTDIEMLGCFE